MQTDTRENFSLSNYYSPEKMNKREIHNDILNLLSSLKKNISMDSQKEIIVSALITDESSIKTNTAQRPLIELLRGINYLETNMRNHKVSPSEASYFNSLQSQKNESNQSEEENLEKVSTLSSRFSGKEEAGNFESQSGFSNFSTPKIFTELKDHLQTLEITLKKPSNNLQIINEQETKKIKSQEIEGEIANVSEFEVVEENQSKNHRIVKKIRHTPNDNLHMLEIIFPNTFLSLVGEFTKQRVEAFKGSDYLGWVDINNSNLAPEDETIQKYHSELDILIHAFLRDLSLEMNTTTSTLSGCVVEGVEYKVMVDNIIPVSTNKSPLLTPKYIYNHLKNDESKFCFALKKHLLIQKIWAKALGSYLACQESSFERLIYTIEKNVVYSFTSPLLLSEFIEQDLTEFTIFVRDSLSDRVIGYIQQRNESNVIFWDFQDKCVSKEYSKITDIISEFDEDIEFLLVKSMQDIRQLNTKEITLEKGPTELALIFSGNKFNRFVLLLSEHPNIISVKVSDAGSEVMRKGNKYDHKIRCCTSNAFTLIRVPDDGIISLNSVNETSIRIFSESSIGALKY